MNLRADYRDNPRLQISPDQVAHGAVVDVTLPLSWRDDRTSVTAQTTLRVARYPGYELVNANDATLDLGLARQFERGQITASVGAARDHTLTSEIETTGIVQANRPREFYSIGTGVQWSPFERLVLGGQLAYQVTNYAPDPLRLLVDYQYGSVNLYGKRSFDEMTSLTVTASAGGIRGAQIPDESNNYAVQIGVDHIWNEFWKGTASLGPSRVAPRGAPATQGITYSAGITHSGERTQWALGAQQGQIPTGRGAFEFRKEISTSLSRSMTETWTTECGLQLIQNQAGYRNRFTLDQQRTYGRAYVDVSWRWAPKWTVSMNYAYSSEHFRTTFANPFENQQTTNQTPSNEVSINIAWNGWRRAVSR